MTRLTLALSAMQLAVLGYFGWKVYEWGQVVFTTIEVGLR